MKRTLTMLLALMLGLALLGGCGTQARKPTQDILLTKQALGLIERARHAYLARNLSGLKSLVSKEVYEAIPARALRHGDAELEFTTEWVEIQADDSVETRIGWTGRWPDANGKGAQEVQGRAVIVSRGKPGRITAIRGQNPFHGPGMPLEAPRGPAH